MMTTKNVDGRRVRMAAGRILIWVGCVAWVWGGQAAEKPQVRVDTSPLAAEVKQSTSFAPVIKRVAPSVVNIYTSKRIELSTQPAHPFFNDPFFRRFFGDPGDQPRSRQERNLGSGVVVSEDGYLLTAAHVVEGADDVKVALPEEEKEYQAEIIGTDPQTDIAVLKIEAEGLSAAVMADSDQLEVGDTVLAIGNPFGVGQTVTVGIVSAKERGMGLVDYEDFIQTDASINPGNSGGALVDAQGRLVGINTAILSRSGGNQGIGFAVPINLARSVMDRLVVYGKVSRGFLGVFIQPITPGLAKAFELPDRKGALVGGVIPDSPAERAGLQDGDVILSVEGEPLEDNRDLRFKIAQYAPGTKIELQVLREGKERAVEVELDELQPDMVARRGPGENLESGLAGPLEGVEVKDLGQEEREQYSVPARIEGVLVTKVAEDSPAYEAGIRPGQVIMSVNRETVREARALAALSRKAEGGQLLLLVWSEEGSRFVLLSAGRDG